MKLEAINNIETYIELNGYESDFHDIIKKLKMLYITAKNQPERYLEFTPTVIYNKSIIKFQFEVVSSKNGWFKVGELFSLTEEETGLRNMLINSLAHSRRMSNDKTTQFKLVITKKGK